MTMTEPPDAPLVVAAFLARYFADQEAGTVRAREEYEALFPGFADVVAAEFARLQQGQASPDEVAGERLAGYRIVREIGRGGQGIVYLAEDEKLGRQVALKVLPGAFSATVARQRLLREAQAASRLDDPGICTVYDAGEQDGVAFIAMRYVDGESLLERIGNERRARDEGRLDLAEPNRVKGLIDVFAAVLRSLHAAHQKGLVHRDVKPSNLMVALDGTPMILDFGLAAFDDHPDGSLTGEVALGTPAYMSPEQLSARQGRVDARSDVFSLAVTFYEALVLEHPFAAPTRERLYQHILQDEPALLRSHARGLPGDLEVVLRCALDKDRARRYATAADFAADLLAVRNHEPIRAKKVSGAERVARWAQRNPLVAALALLLFAALVTFVLSMASKNRDLSHALQDAQTARQITVESLGRERAARERAQALFLVGQSSDQLADDPELALLLAQQANRRLDHPLARGAVRAALERWRPRPFVPAVAGVEWAKVSPDGARAALALADEIVIVDARSRQRVAAIPCPESEHADLWWSPQGQHVVVAVDNDILRFVGEHEFDESRFAVRLHDAMTGALIADLPGHRGKLHCVDFDDHWLLTGDGPRAPEFAAGLPGSVRVWSLADGRLDYELPDCGLGVAAARFVGNERAQSWPDLEVLSRECVYRRVQGGRGRTLDERRLVDAAVANDPAIGSRPRVFFGEPGEVFLQHDGQLLRYEPRSADQAVATAGVSGACSMWPGGPLLSRTPSPQSSIRLLRTGNLQLDRELPLPPREIVHLGPGQRLAFRGSIFAGTETTFREPTVQAVFADGSMRVWMLATKSFEDLPPIGGGVVDADFSRDGATAATLDAQGRVRVFEVFGGSALPAWNGASLSSWEALHPDGASAVTFRRGQAVLVDLTTAGERWVVEPADDASAVCAAWSPDGALCAIGHDDGQVLVVRGDTAETVFTLPAEDHEVRSLEFDESGQHLLVLRTLAEAFDVGDQRRVLRLAAVPMLVSAGFVGNEHIVVSRTTSCQVFTFPGGEQVGTGDRLDWPPGVPAGAAGPLVLLCGTHEAPRGRVGGFAAAALLDVRDGDRTELAAGRFGRGGLLPDGRSALLPLPDGSIEMRDLTTGAMVRVLRGHQHAANCVRFARDGAVFATGFAAGSFASPRDERSICIWSDGGELLQQLVFERAGVSWFELSPDGEWVVVKTNDGELRRHPVRPLDVLAGLPLRELTAAERERFEVGAGH